MGAMSTVHLLYIPIVLIMGIVLGYVFGARAARAAQAGDRERMKE